MNTKHPIHQYLSTKLTAADQIVLDSLIFSLQERQTCLENAIDIDTEDARYQYQVEFSLEHVDVNEAIRFIAFTSKFRGQEIKVWTFNDSGDNLDSELTIPAPTDKMTIVSASVHVKQALINFIAQVELEEPEACRIELGIKDGDSTHYSDCTGELSLERVKAELEQFSIGFPGDFS